MSKLTVPGDPDIRIEVVHTQSTMECLIGNTIIAHQSLAAHIYPAYWSSRLFWRKMIATFRNQAGHICRCGYHCRPGQTFSYHVAEEIIKVLQVETEEQLHYTVEGVHWA